MNTFDLEAPFDPTAYPQISGAQLLQLIQGAVPSSDRGFCLFTTDVAGVPVVPDAAATPEWKRYLWLRQTATSISAYAWNDTASSNATYLKWISINISGIGVGTITGDMIANNTITDIKIISLDWSKLTGIPDGLMDATTPAGGDLSGLYPNPVIANAAVTGAKIAADTITVANIADAAVENDKLKPNAVGLAIKRTNAGATAVEDAVVKVTELTNPTVAEANKLVKVNNAGTGFEYGGVSTAAVAMYRSALTAIGATTGNVIAPVAHGLGGAPDVVKVKLVCTTIDNGYQVGDVIDGNMVTDYNSSGASWVIATGGGDAVNVWGCYAPTAAGLGTIFATKGANTTGVFTPGSWSMQIIAIKYS